MIGFWLLASGFWPDKIRPAATSQKLVAIMDAVIMCAGLGTRLRPITERVPKPLVPIAGRSSLERTLDRLPESVTGIILVIGYLGHMIKDRIGTELDGRPVRYVTQDVLDGTGGALRRARPAITTDRFLILNGDDLYDADDLVDLSRHDHAILYEHRIMDAPVDSWIISPDGFIVDIEKIAPGNPSKMNAGAYALTKAWFDTEPVLVPGKATEWSLPHAIPELVLRGYPVKALQTRFWMPVGTPEELEKAERMFREEVRE